MKNASRWLLGPLLAAGLLVAFGALSAAASAETPEAGQGTWVSAEKNLKDPTLTYTQEYHCDYATPKGQDTLYPYYVRTHGYEFEYRNSSSKGVTVTGEGPDTDEMHDEGIALSVTSLHTSGDYALRVSWECQSNAPESFGHVKMPTLESVGPESATVQVPLIGTKGTEPYRWFVEYGTGYAEYTQHTPVETGEWKGEEKKTITIHGLQPGTTYHYRVLFENEDSELVERFADYSGEDQTFTTSAAGTGVASEVDELSFGEEGNLRLAAPAEGGSEVEVVGDDSTADQEWGLTEPGAGETTAIVSAKTGLCLDLGRTRATEGSLVTDRCRPGAEGQEWEQRQVGGRTRLVNQEADEVLGISSKSHQAVLASLASKADQSLKLVAPDGGGSRRRH
ncbi:MAG TPA: RICIN domain-containing protein [Solirubrobacterales bacterium]